MIHVNYLSYKKLHIRLESTKKKLIFPILIFNHFFLQIMTLKIDQEDRCSLTQNTFYQKVARIYPTTKTSECYEN